MGILQKLKIAVCEHDFVQVATSKDGTASWFSKTSANMRLCIDGLTNSVTVFWATGPAKLNAKTFRIEASLKD